MNKPKVSIIVAMDLKRGIGKNNRLLWHIPEELKHFRELTTGHPIIMGRKTYESIGRPLPNRINIVITRDPGFKAEGTVVVNSLNQALETARNVILASETRPESDSGVAGLPRMTEVEPEIFIIGGGQIYKQAMESGMVDKLYVTIVQRDPTSQSFSEQGFEATVFFPEYENVFTKKVSEKEIEVEGTKDGKHMTFKVKFLELEKDV